MSATAPTPKGTLQQSKTTYISWGDFDFELVGNNTFRPRLKSARKTEVESNVKTYTSATPKDGYEDMKINVLYDPTIWEQLKTAKEAGTVQKLETSDGFEAQAMIFDMDEVTSDIPEPITDMGVTFTFPTVADAT